MKRYTLQSIALCAALLPAPPAMAEAGEFNFGVISHPSEPSPDDSMLRDAIEETDADNLAFVVASGIKSSAEPCTDKVYQRRKALLETAKNGLIVSLAASDWAECKNENGKSAAIGKLGRLRDLFFDDEFSIGATKVPVTRQSTAAKFRGVVENARWELGNVMFATINLPANNNHYVYDAGRNSEFEDRLVANRNWLNRIFTFAVRKKVDGVVLFCDGNPLSPKLASNERRDGYVETRKQIIALAAKFPGKLLIIHGQPDNPAEASSITWRGNLGELGVGTGWTKITVNQSSSALFVSEKSATHGPNNGKLRSRKRSEGVALR